MKNEKGVTLVILAITVMVLIILAVTININAAPYLEERKKADLETDLIALKEEVEQYYLVNKKLPLLDKYPETFMFDSVKNINDSEDEYYIIDINKIDVELNYGKGFENLSDVDDVSDITDIYIINKQSHTIYYPQGIVYNKQRYYTLEDNYTKIEKIEGYVNKPKLLDGMTPIKFTMPTNTAQGIIVTTTENDEDWYNYGVTYDTKKWANAKTEDGSMWVWIPRYAYKIDSATNTIQVVFLLGNTDNYYDEDGNIKTAQRQSEKNTNLATNTDVYTVHPAFTDESKIDYENGGWDKELTGIWVAKFEAGYASGNNNVTVKASKINYSNSVVYTPPIENGTGSYSNISARNWLDGIYGGTTTAIKYPVFMPLTYSMNYINHNDAYLISKSLTDEGNIYGLNNKNADSHMMKNSEWGAVAYLAKSSYGQNEQEITINNVNLNSGNRTRTAIEGKTEVDSVYAITGCTSNTTDTGENITTLENIKNLSGNTSTQQGIYSWNQLTGQNASTTGTIYGIYDMSGGVWERVSEYNQNGGANLNNNGLSLKNETKKKYVTIYSNSKYGSATSETLRWESDDCSAPDETSPFLFRGGNLYSNSGAGIFAYNKDSGSANFAHGFRAVLINK